MGSNLRYSNTVVLMNEAEWELLEMMDSAYKVHCGFTPDVTQTLANGITVPMIGVTDLPITIPNLPECRMKIVAGKDAKSQRASSLVLGEIASMVFYLNMDGPSESFDIFVFHCYTSDGTRNKRIELVDGAGCPAQQKIVGHTVYDRGQIVTGETLAYTHFKVFKFPDIPNVYFECQCRVCVDNCEKPICPGLRGKRDLSDQLITAPGQETGPQQPVEHMRDVSVLETIEVEVPHEANRLRNDQRDRGEVKLEKASISSSHQTMVSRRDFVVAMVVMGLLLLLSLILCVVLCIRNRRRKEKEPEPSCGYSGYNMRY